MSTPRLSLAGRFAAVMLLILLALAAWLQPLDDLATEQLDAGLKRALVSFASARALNAALSLAQGTEFALQPAGVGVKLSVGQVLAPLNDLVENFADLMLLASIAFGVQKMLLIVGAHPAVSLLFSGLAVICAAFCLTRRRAPWLWRLLLVLAIVRFAIPLVTIGSDLVFESFLAEDYRQSQAALDVSVGGAASASAAVSDDPAADGLFGRIRGWLEAQGGAWKERLHDLRATVEATVGHIVRLMAIFLLQTLLLPLLIAWGGYAILRSLLFPALRAR